ncbi:PilZ domain-containing protein [Desulfogranum marinum]|uniref:PilZ domain-containing protein n=1 Tax=Desulfogranum marinum TaxID=453220 RepID=UPI0019663FB7|nr:PilZ domain-containing protein [Desulfogranum marinum]MBM9513354.1 PilZ domain-containing protein [Desulfogranum marinum]
MSKQTSHARADTNHNRLYIRIGRKLTKPDLDNLYTDIRFCVADLSPGFSVITDLSQCTIASLSGLPTFRKISNFLIDNQVGTVVRVMNDKSVVFRQFMNLTDRTQGYKPINVSTVDEAEKRLLEAEKRTAPRFRLYKQPVEIHKKDIQYTGVVIDISTGGCAIQTDTSLPELGDDLSIKIHFNDHEEFISEFNISAQVAKVMDDWFAVRFISLGEEVEKQLEQRLLHESKSDLIL